MDNSKFAAHGLDGDFLLKRIRTYQEHLSSHAEQQKREAIEHKYMDALSVAGGALMVVAPFMLDSLGAEVSLMGAMAMTSNPKVKTIIKQCFELGDKVKDELHSLIQKREGVTPDKIERLVTDKAHLVDMAIRKASDIVTSDQTLSARLYIDSKYQYLRMNNEDRQFFNNAVGALEKQFNYPLWLDQSEVVEKALLRSRSGAIQLAEEGIVEKVGKTMDVLIRKADLAPAAAVPDSEDIASLGLR